MRLSFSPQFLIRNIKTEHQTIGREISLLPLLIMQSSISQCLSPMVPLHMVHLLEILLVASGNYLITSYFPDWEVRHNTLERLRLDVRTLGVKSACWRSAHLTKPPTAACPIALLFLLPGNGIWGSHMYHSISSTTRGMNGMIIWC